MSSTNHRNLLSADLKKFKSEQLDPVDPLMWRLGPPDPAKFLDIGENFEVLSSMLVGADDRIKGKRLHGAAAIRTAFADASLDPRRPNHWLYLMGLFADAHYLRRPKSKMKKRALLDKIKIHAEEIRKQFPHLNKTQVIDKMKKCSKDYPSERTMEKLMQEAGVRWYKQLTKKRRRLKNAK